jgi:hypothetical protein
VLAGVAGVRLFQGLGRVQGKSFAVSKSGFGWPCCQRFGLSPTNSARNQKRGFPFEVGGVRGRERSFCSRVSESRQRDRERERERERARERERERERERKRERERARAQIRGQQTRIKAYTRRVCAR